MADKKLDLVDPASGKKTQLPVRSGTLGPDVVDIAPMVKEFGAFTYDPGYGATAAVESKITYIDGDQGVLLHRGYPIEQLAAKSSFIEVCYLLLNGELPSKDQLDQFEHTQGDGEDRIRHRQDGSGVARKGCSHQGCAGTG